MNKKTFRYIMAVIITAVFLIDQAGNAVAFAAEKEFSEETVDLLSSSKEDTGKITIRFYSEMPDVPFIGLAQYKDLIDHEKITVEECDGCVILTAEDGSSVKADPVAGTLTSDSFAQFRNNEKGMTEGGEVGFSDFNTPFLKIVSVEYAPLDKPTVLDLAAYDIPIHTDENDVYIPLATATDLMIDAGYNFLEYDGKNVCLRRGFSVSEETIDKDYYKHILDNKTRKKDMVEYAYNELCFVMDKLYGCPGRSFIDRVIAKKGLDRALSETDEITARIKEKLLSEDRDEYLSGLLMLDTYVYDKHTVTYDWNLLSHLKDSNEFEKINRITKDGLAGLKDKDYYQDLVDSGYLDRSLSEEREKILGDGETYHEKGDTALIAVNDFINYDEKGWVDYYNKKGDVPDGTKAPDIAGTLLSDLKKAKSNPQIKKVILDLSNNTGGSNNLMMFVMSLFTGKADMPCYDRITGQYYTIHYSTDSLLDGSFDTDAAFDSMDYSFAVLTTQNSFSCGNAAPSLAKDSGLPLFGEPSGGGTCMVRALVLPEGEVCTMSSGFGVMVNQKGESLENGTPVDAYIVRKAKDGKKDYSELYDIDRLSSLMEEWEEFKTPAGLFPHQMQDQAPYRFK